MSSVNNCTQTPKPGEKSDSKPAELPRNIDDLRQYSRQQKQEIIDRLKREPRLSADEAFTITIQHMKATVNDISATQWGPEVKAAYREFINLTPEEQAEHWRKNYTKRRCNVRPATPAPMPSTSRRKPKPFVIQNNVLPVRNRNAGYLKHPAPGAPFTTC